ncbi:MAG: hypothetical protein GY725_09000 [bacterium]|nr:hypothetical protein [bacterium]
MEHPSLTSLSLPGRSTPRLGNREGRRSLTGYDPTPSAQDFEVTRRIIAAGRLVGVELLDHIVWARDGSYRALRTESPLLFQRD